jgi:hypothetical protein
VSKAAVNNDYLTLVLLSMNSGNKLQNYGNYAYSWKLRNIELFVCTTSRDGLRVPNKDPVTNHAVDLLKESFKQTGSDIQAEVFWVVTMPYNFVV